MMESINLVAQIAKLIELDSLPLREIVKCIKELSQSLNRLKTIKDPEKLQENTYELYSKVVFEIERAIVKALIEKGLKKKDITKLFSNFSSISYL